MKKIFQDILGAAIWLIFGVSCVIIAFMIGSELGILKDLVIITLSVFGTILTLSAWNYIKEKI